MCSSFSKVDHLSEKDRQTHLHYLVSIANFLSQSHSITLSEILGLSPMLSDGYHGNGAVLWPSVYAEANTYSLFLSPSLSHPNK